MIRAFLDKVFDIREGELFRAWSMQLNIFLIITTLLILKPTVNSLFLSAYGIESLPNAYIFVAIVAGLVTTAYSKIIHYVRFVYLNIATLVSSVLLLLFFGMALQTGIWPKGILYLFYIWVAIFAVLTTSQFWLLVNQVFNVREIKRLVGFIGSGAIAGGIFGGYLTSFLIQHTSSKNLPFVAALTIGLCIPLTLLIFRKRQKSAPRVLDGGNKEKAREHPLRLILQSRHLTLLAGLVAVGNVVAKLVDYQFSDIASSRFSDPEQLTAFFGFWFSTFNVAALLIQLLATRLILNRLGVGASLLFLPVAIGISVVCLIIAPELLIAVIAMKMADGSLKQSVNKSAMELLILPISNNVKNQTKTFIDVFIDSLAAGFSGLLLIFVVKGLSLSSVSISVLILGFTGLWILLVTNVRKEYLYSFKMKIINNVEVAAVNLASSREQGITREVIQMLKSGTPEQIISTLQQILLRKDKRYLNNVYKLLDHSESEVRVEAIQYLSHYKDKKVYQRISKMAEDTSVKVQLAAFSYMIEHTPLKKKDLIDKQLDSRNKKLSGLALISLAVEIQNNAKLKEKYKLKARIERQVNLLEDINNTALKHQQKIFCIQAIGYANIPELYPLLRNFMKGENTIVIRQALQAAGRTHDDYFLKDLIRFSTKNKYSRMAHTSLKSYGKRLLLFMKYYMERNPEDVPLIRRFPFLTKYVKPQKAVLFLFKLLEHDDSIVRQRALEVLGNVNRENPRLRIKKKKIIVKIFDEILRLQSSLALFHGQMNLFRQEGVSKLVVRKRVVELLRKQIHSQSDNILFLLSLRYLPENISVVKKGLKSSKMQMRITALEFLDNLLDNQLKKMLIPLFEVALVDYKLRRNIDKLELTIPDEYQCFDTILKSAENIRLKISILHLIQQLNNPYYRSLVEECLYSDDLELKLMAKNILSQMEQDSVAVVTQRS